MGEEEEEVVEDLLMLRFRGEDLVGDGMGFEGVRNGTGFGVEAGVVELVVERVKRLVVVDGGVKAYWDKAPLKLGGWSVGERVLVAGERE